MQGWAEVEKELVDLGMGDARTAIAAALDHRCPPEFLRALIAHYRIHADGWESVGALYYRILTAYPDQDPADATRWLPFRAGYRTPQAIEAERLAAVERVLREREAEESRQRQRAADLSADARLAELSGDELDELIDRAFGPSAKRELCRREWKRSGLAGLAMFRGPLVAALSEGAAR